MKKNIVITGGGQGIGFVIAEELLKNSYAVTVLEADREAAAEMKKAFGRTGLQVLETDVSSEIQVKIAMDRAVEHHGRIDGLINNAAVMIRRPLAELSRDEWDRVLAVNLTGPFLCAKYAEAELRKNKGVIINICSTRAFQSEPDTESYSASKGGLLSLTHALAVSLGPDVRVNAISPGWIDVSERKKPSARRQELLSEADHAQHPAGRVGKPEDIAAMALFLLNETNSFVTAQNFIVDGGMTRKMIYV